MARQSRLRVVLDTNILLDKHRLHLLILARQNVYQVVWSDYILLEVKRVMSRMGWTDDNARRLLQVIDHLAERADYRQITGGNYDEWLHDPDDHPIMSTALVGKVDYIVTDNVKDFPPKKRFAGITVITSEMFIRMLEHG